MTAQNVKEGNEHRPSFCREHQTLKTNQLPQGVAASHIEEREKVADKLFGAEIINETTLWQQQVHDLTKILLIKADITAKDSTSITRVLSACGADIVSKDTHRGQQHQSRQTPLPYRPLQ